jgi:hypothetical protein
MGVLQCPRCPVRFRFPSELRDHLDTDHPGFAARPMSVAEDLLGACHCHHHHHRVKDPGPSASGGNAA